MNVLKYSFLFMSLLLIVSCNEDSTHCDALDFSELNQSGVLHNNYMANLEVFEVANFDGEMPIEEKIDIVTGFHQSYTNNLEDRSIDDKTLFNSYLVQYSPVMDHGHLYDEMFVSQSFMDQPRSMYDSYQILKDQDFINDYELSLLKEIHNKVKANKDGGLGATELQDFISAKKLEWDNQNFTKCDNYGYVSGLVLSVAQNSIDYWLNYDSGEIELRVAPWVAADVGGALIGAVVGAVGGADDVGLGTSIIAGAVVGSTGLAGRIGKFLFR